MKAKEDALIKKYDKENYKRLEGFMKNILQLTSGGIQTDAFLCLAELDADNPSMTFSYDGIHMRCPDYVYDDAEGTPIKQNVSIKDYCKIKVNPKSKEPGCIYFASMQHLFKLTAKELQEHDIKTPEFLQPQIEEQENPQPPLKIIEAEYETVEEVEKDE